MSFYQGKKVLITGASAGIGYALAEELAQLGAEIIITARRRDRLDELAGKIENLGAKAHVFVEDLSLPESGTKLYDQIKSAGLSVDILINNAGYGRWGELTSFERDDYAKMLQLNVTTLTDLCHLYLPDMVAQGGGGIINVGSMASLSPVPYASIYSSSKAYVLMFSEAIRYEYRIKASTSWRFCQAEQNQNLPKLRLKSQKNLLKDINKEKVQFLVQQCKPHKKSPLNV